MCGIDKHNIDPNIEGIRFDLKRKDRYVSVYLDGIDSAFY